MKLAALLIALALAAPSQSYAQVFRSEPAKTAKKSKAKKAKKAKKSKARPREVREEEAAPEEEAAVVSTRSKGRTDKVAENDVVVIIDGEE
jgi:hypothetical protein